MERSSRPPSRSRSRTSRKKSNDQKMKQMQKKIRELESKLDVLSNQVNNELIKKDDNEETINQMNEDIDNVVQENVILTSVIEKHTYDITAIKNTIDSLTAIYFEWDEKCRDAREREEGGIEEERSRPDRRIAWGEAPVV